MDLSQQLISSEPYQASSMSQAERTLRNLSALAPIYAAMQPAFEHFAGLMGRVLTEAELTDLEGQLKTQYTHALVDLPTDQLPKFGFFLNRAIAIYCANSTACGGRDCSHACELGRTLRQQNGFETLATQLQDAFPDGLDSNAEASSLFYWPDEAGLRT